jgi:hypothetical protein
VERNIICCYAAEEGGHFRALRDNTTEGHCPSSVRHIDQSDDLEGGELMFAEYGPRVYKGPPGRAVVFFGCALACGHGCDALPALRICHSSTTKRLQSYASERQISGGGSVDL